MVMGRSSTFSATDHDVIKEGTILKLANLTQGRFAAFFAATAILLPACDNGGDDTTGANETESASETQATETETPTTGSDTESPTSETDAATTDETSDTDPSEGTDTGVIEGLGCDMPVDCSKGVYEGSPTVTTPEEVAELAGYTEITGRLAIANSDLECLTFLSCLTSVGHDLNIFNNDLLTDVSGLDNVEAIGAVTDGPLMPGGTLTISENESLVDFNTLNLIEQTPISLSISENASLTTISGFQGFVGTQKNFEIRFNDQLETVTGGLRNILLIGGECVVTNNPNLCISTIEDMCSLGIKQGPFGGSTANNDNGC